MKNCSCSLSLMHSVQFCIPSNFEGVNYLTYTTFSNIFPPQIYHSSVILIGRKFAYI